MGLLKIDFKTAEAMLNHVKKGLERTYDTYELEDEKQAWFQTWEAEITGIAREAGVAEALGVPAICASRVLQALHQDALPPSSVP